MLAIIALTTTPANRRARFTVENIQTSISLRPTAQIQHRDRDADERGFSSADFSLLWVAETATTVEPTEPVYVRIQYDSLNNRPPPGI